MSKKGVTVLFHSVPFLLSYQEEGNKPNGSVEMAGSLKEGRHVERSEEQGMGNQAEGFVLKAEAAGSPGREWSEWCGDAGRKGHRLHRMNPRGRDQQACHWRQTWTRRVECTLTVRKRGPRENEDKLRTASKSRFRGRKNITLKFLGHKISRRVEK